MNTTQRRLLMVALGVVILQMVARQWVNEETYQLTARDITQCLAEKNPLWNESPAPVRGETRIEQQIRKHVAEQLCEFADPYPPMRPLERAHQMIFPHAGAKPQLSWLRWAVDVAPFDIRTVRTEIFWILQEKGPKAATIACEKAVAQNPTSTLLMLDLAHGVFMGGTPHRLGQYCLPVIKKTKNWQKWQIKDVAMLADIFYGELQMAHEAKDPIQSKLAAALGKTLVILEQKRNAAGLPPVTFKEAFAAVHNRWKQQITGDRTVKK